MLASITSKGQITIPKNIRSQLNIKTNDKVEFIIEGERVILLPVKTLKDLRGAVSSSQKLDFAQARELAKERVAKRVVEEMDEELLS